MLISALSSPRLLKPLALLLHFYSNLGLRMIELRE